MKQITFPAYAFNSCQRSVVIGAIEWKNNGGLCGDQSYLVFDIAEQRLELFFKLASDA